MASSESSGSSAPGAIVLVPDDPVPYLRFTGHIDRDAVREFRLAVHPAAWPSRVDLTRVTSMEPAGLELLLHLARKQKRIGAELEVVDPPAPLRRLLGQSGLSRLSRRTAADAPPQDPGPLGTAAAG